MIAEGVWGDDPVLVLVEVDLTGVINEVVAEAVVGRVGVAVNDALDLDVTLV